MVFLTLCGTLQAELTGGGEELTEYLDRALLTRAPTARARSYSESTKQWETNIRLPRHITPLHYAVHLHPDLETDTFTGHVHIQIEIAKPCQAVWIHTKHLNITNTQLNTDLGEKVEILEAFEFAKNEFWVIQPETLLQKGEYTISVQFTGSLVDGLDGLYKSVYTNQKGEEVAIATSKFEPTSARKAFPCFDEPSFKATFSVSLVRPSTGYIALSNMPVQEETSNTPSRGLTTVTFDKSVPMATYLACFIVCDFGFEETLTSTGQTRMRVYAAKDQMHRVQYSLGAGANMTAYFDNYFGIPYPLPKQDMIAIPDFAAGAMEHWGLITYR